MSDPMKHYSQNLLELLRTGAPVQIVFHEPGVTKNSPDDSDARFAITCGDRFYVHHMDPVLLAMHRLGADVALIEEMAVALDVMVRQVRGHGTKAPPP